MAMVGLTIGQNSHSSGASCNTCLISSAMSNNNYLSFIQAKEKAFRQGKLLLHLQCNQLGLNKMSLYILYFYIHTFSTKIDEVCLHENF